MVLFLREGDIGFFLILSAVVQRFLYGLTSALFPAYKIFFNYDLVS